MTKVAVVLAFALAGCGVSAASESLASCRAGGDEDSDGMFGCKDPDCWAFDVCAQAMLTSGSRDGGAGLADGGTLAQDASAANGGDAGRLELDDASVPVNDAGGDGAAPLCPDASSCEPPPPPPPDVATYIVTITSGALPDQTKGLTCFDNPLSGAACVSVGFVLCSNCKPDPYVEVSLNGDIIQVSEVVDDTVAPVWQDFSFQLTLHKGDDLRFTVKDRDVTDPSDPIFWCRPDLSHLATSSIVRCVPDPKLSPTFDAPPGQPWNVTSTFERVQ
jgi:hypothetical protein